MGRRQFGGYSNISEKDVKVNPWALEKTEGKTAWIASLDVMINQIMESNTIEMRTYEDLEDKLEDVIDMLGKRVPHGDILDHLKVKGSNEYQFRKLW